MGKWSPICRIFFHSRKKKKKLDYPNQICVCPNNKIPHSFPENFYGTFWAKESQAGGAWFTHAQPPWNREEMKWTSESSLSLSLSGGLCLNSVTRYAFHFNFTCLGCLALVFSSGNNIADHSNYSFIFLPCKTESALVYSPETLCLQFSTLLCTLHSGTGSVV